MENESLAETRAFSALLGRSYSDPTVESMREERERIDRLISRLETLSNIPVRAGTYCQ